jgi:hypothetical protein
LGVQRGASIGGMLNVPKKLIDEPMNMILSKNQKQSSLSLLDKTRSRVL